MYLEYFTLQIVFLRLLQKETNGNLMIEDIFESVVSYTTWFSPRN